MPNQVGASFGATCGLLLMKWLPESWHIQPGVYAMCAAAAMLGGVFRASLSVVVIFVEGSQVRALLGPYSERMTSCCHLSACKSPKSSLLGPRHSTLNTLAGEASSSCGKAGFCVQHICAEHDAC